MSLGKSKIDHRPKDEKFMKDWIKKTKNEGKL